jgi:hypothetical protein
MVVNPPKYGCMVVDSPKYGLAPPYSETDVSTPNLRVFGDVHGLITTYSQIANKSPCSIQLGDLGFDYEKMLSLDPSRHVFIGGNHDNYELQPTSIDPADHSVLNPPSLLTFVDKNETFYLDIEEQYNIWTIRHLPNFEESVVCEYKNMPPHFLGNYGWWEVPDIGKKIFFIRGAWSIDGQIRRKNSLGWYPREQMSPEELTQCINFYEQEKPDFVVSHCAPLSAVKFLNLHYTGGKVVPTATGRAMDFMWQIHQPNVWIFAHYHQQFDRKIGKTRFICLNTFPNDGWYLDLDENLDVLGFDL